MSNDTYCSFCQHGIMVKIEDVDTRISHGCVTHHSSTTAVCDTCSATTNKHVPILRRIVINLIKLL